MCSRPRTTKHLTPGKKPPPRKTDELRSGKLGREDRRAKRSPSLTRPRTYCAHRRRRTVAQQRAPPNLSTLSQPRRTGSPGPIERRNKKKNREIFWTYIDRYLLPGRKADGAMVKILYEAEGAEPTSRTRARLDGLFDHLPKSRPTSARRSRTVMATGCGVLTG